MPEIPLPIPARAVKQAASVGVGDYFLMVVGGLLRRVSAQEAQDSVFQIPGTTVLGNPGFFPAAAQGMSPEATKNLLAINTSDVHGLQQALDQKANLIHTHAIADVLGLQAALDALAAGFSVPAFARATYVQLAAEITQPDNTLGMVYADTVISSTQRSRTSNVTTVTFGVAHGYLVGQTVQMWDMGGGDTNNGAKVVTSLPNANSITFASVGANEGVTTDTGGRSNRDGIYQFDDPTNLWSYVAQAPFAQLERRISRVESIVYDFSDPGLNAAAGMLFQSDGAGPGSGGWAARHFLADSVKNPQWFSDLNTYQVKASVAPPVGEITVTPDGQELQIASTRTLTHWFITAQSLLGKVYPNRSFYMKGKLISASGTFGPDSFGVGITFSPEAPTGGAAPNQMHANAETLTWRVNGGIIVYKRDATTSVGTAIVANHQAGSPAWKAGDIVEVTVSVDALSTGAAATFILNGEVVFRSILTGLQPGLFVGATIRSLDNTVARILSYKVSDPNIGVPRDWYIDPSVGSTGNGTTKAPWKDFKDAVAEDNSDSIQGRYNITMKDGICLSGPNFAGKKIKEVILRSSSGNRAIIHNAVYIPAGGGTFTRPSPSLHPQVWQMTIPSGVGIGNQLVDASRPQPQGLTGLVVAEFSHYSRATFNTSIDVIQAKPGWMSAQYQPASPAPVNPYAGKILIHAYEDVDPNTHNWWLTRAPGIAVQFESDNNFNSPKLIIDGVSFGFCGGAAITVERGYLEATNFEVYGSVAGIQANNSDFKLYGGVVRGTVADNINCSNSLDLPTITRKAQGFMWGTKMLGCPVGLLDGTIFGDCFSNHDLTEIYAEGCVFRSGAKDGLGAVDNCTAIDCIAEDNVQYGMEFVSIGYDTTHRIIGGRIEGNGGGLALTNANPVGKSVIATVDGGTHIRNNQDFSLRTLNASAGAGITLLRAYDWCISGATPSDGHINQVNGTIEALTPRNLGDFS
jgi:hypothetical protein